MAGTRKSHKKSKNGCNRCKLRHIRCDEMLPQCAKCMGQGYRCDFLDGAPLALLGSRARRELLPTPSSVQARKDTQEMPATALQLAPQVPRALALTPICSEEQYLLHHLASRLTCRETSKLSRYMLGVAFMPRQGPVQSRSAVLKINCFRFLVIAECFDFVRYAALAVSALDLARGCQDGGVIFQKYQSKAVQGVRKSLAVFSKDIADAVLAASILLSLQAVDVFSFASFTCGTASVIESIQDRKDDVFLADIASNTFSDASNVQARAGVAVPRPNTLRNEEKMYEIMKRPLEELRKRLSDLQAARESVVSLLETCWWLQDPLARTDVTYRFAILNPAMRQLFWLPTLMTRSPADKWIILLMAYWYAMIMSLEPIRYAPVSQLLRSSCVNPVAAISEELRKLPKGEETTVVLQLMELPVLIANDMQEQIKQHEREVQSAGLRRGIRKRVGE